MSEVATTVREITHGGMADPVSDAIITAQRLSLTGKRGAVYGPLSIEIPLGSLTMLQGAQGSGRTSLLLTLAGRMKHSSGDLTVAGRVLSGRSSARQSRETQLTVAIAGFSEIDELDNSVTVAQSIRERQIWLSPWYRSAPKLSQSDYQVITAPVFGERKPPALDARVWDLDEVDTLLLRIAIALLQNPKILVIDDLDQVHDSARRQFLWTQLETLTEQGLTIIVSVASADEFSRMNWTAAPRVLNFDQPDTRPTHSRHGRN